MSRTTLQWRPPPAPAVLALLNDNGICIIQQRQLPLSSVSFILPPHQYPVFVHPHTSLWFYVPTACPSCRPPALCFWPSVIPLSPASTWPLNHQVNLLHQYTTPASAYSLPSPTPVPTQTYSNLLSPVYYVMPTCSAVSGYASKMLCQSKDQILSMCPTHPCSQCIHITMRHVYWLHSQPRIGFSVCAPLIHAANVLTLQQGTYADRIAKDYHMTHTDSWTISKIQQTYLPGPAPGVWHIHHQLPHWLALNPQMIHAGYTYTNQMAPILVWMHSFTQQYTTVATVSFNDNPNNVCKYIFYFSLIQSDNDVMITPSAPGTSHLIHTLLPNSFILWSKWYWRYSLVSQ